MGEIIRAEGKELGRLSDSLCGKGSARQLNHGANRELQLHAAFFADFSEECINLVADEMEFHDRANQRHHDLGPANVGA